MSETLTITITEKSTKTAAEILEGAAVLVETNGFCRFTIFEDTGNPESLTCMNGALTVAAGFERNDMAWCRGSCDPEVKKAQRALVSAIKESDHECRVFPAQSDISIICDFNNKIGLDSATVAAMFRKAIHV